MSNYLFETHLHTAEVSTCGHVKAEDAVKIYYNNEYDGIVITDHMHKRYFDALSGNHHQKMDHYLTGYRHAKEAGDRMGIAVILGMELTFAKHPWDILVYGMDESFLYDHKDLITMPMEEFKNLAKAYDFTLIAAHPYRYQDTPAPVWFVDGAEVFNGNPRHDSRNHLAERWAKTYHLMMTAGSDYHQLGDHGSGIYIPTLAKDAKAFVEAIREPNAVTLALPDGELQQASYL